MLAAKGATTGADTVATGEAKDASGRGRGQGKGQGVANSKKGGNGHKTKSVAVWAMKKSCRNFLISLISGQ